MNTLIVAYLIALILAVELSSTVYFLSLKSLKKADFGHRGPKGLLSKR
ncbi:MAG: hypothetical protein HYT79_10415 [Elusimicrobia bacterium]|nr:hypothetical protein [Elusimicrobiota bacterium]